MRSSLVARRESQNNLHSLFLLPEFAGLQNASGDSCPCNQTEFIIKKILCECLWTLAMLDVKFLDQSSVSCVCSFNI